jgi:hypothetical protein
VLERLGGGAHDLRQLLGDLLADDRVGLLLERVGALADRLGLRQYGSIGPPSTSRARKASTPPRIDTITSPMRPGRIPPAEVMRPRQPTGDAPADIWRAAR